MTIYPFDIDSDSDIIRINDDVTEIGGEAINQLRDAVFAIEVELGITPSGSVSSLAGRIDVSLNQDGTIKASALASVGLVTLPIDNAQVGTSAGIAEFKLALDHTTSDLFTLISSNTALLNALNTFSTSTRSDLDTHISGGALLSDGSAGRHVASHIDLNDVTSDIRDPLFTWTGLLDKDGTARAATTVAAALLEINNDFTSHQNSTSGAHVAAAISIDVSNFETVPQTIDDVQKFVDFIDDFDVVTVREHRATQHANGIPLIARSQSLVLPDGYGWQNVVPATLVSTFLVRSPSTMPVDSLSTGDDIVSFVPDNTSFIFDSQFVRVKVGDIIRINYANGTEASFPVESIRFVPGSEWIVRLNGVNLADTDVAFARIDRPCADRDTAGVLAVAAANATPTGSFDSILQSVIVGHPRGASTVGLGFDAGQLDASHYKLYIEMYPTGNPSDRVISLPAIDVTGDAGTRPGQYTLESVIDATNKKLREIGFNYRLIAFSHNGDFAIMMADAINSVGFAIISGSNSAGTLIEGIFTDNVIGDAAGDGFDALGLGLGHSNIASPAFISSFIDATAALIPTKVIVPRKFRFYMADGVKRDEFAATWRANSDGYWDGYISARNPVGSFTIETTYSVELDLKAAGLRPGKTITVQPAVAFTDSLYNDLDYGRFIIKSVSFAGVCPGEPSLTLITVINGIHALGTGFSASGEPSLPVRLYFGEDSVSFNNQNVIDTASPSDYHRLHEIFVSNEGKTFSHERARMPIQAQTSELLATADWHIENVSSKLRGFRDDSVTFNKFVRFYILTYDTVSGEYDGYIGKRNISTAAITNVGAVVTGRKDVPTKFYDETNVDFIEVTFIENAGTIAGSTAILGTAIARYVDIELFESLQLDDELLLLATAEVNWDPQVGQDVIQRVTNRREFGSIDEEDFTSSAKAFISAGDRHLHDNGILRGLDFDFINPTDNREIFYKGGIALVNGTIVSVNNISVTIPEIHLETGTPPTTVDWAVCVNESGSLESIVVTATKLEFFAKDNNSANTYYVPSVTFAELIETRKDLTPIAVVTSNIASTTIANSDHLDVRRFVDDGKNRELVYSPSDFAGTFHTATALVNWTNQYGSTSALKAKVRGTFAISSSLDFSGLTSPLELEGDGAIFNITSEKGLLLGNNISLKGIEFTYNPDLSAKAFVTGDKINADNGCLYSTGSRSNVTIENCSFSSSIATQRAPFISFQIDREDLLQDLVIHKNTFNDSGGSGTGFSDTQLMSAIAINLSNDTALPDAAILCGIRISDNTCNQHQGIFMVPEGINQASSSLSMTGPGMIAFDVIISGNNCGVIGWLTGSTPGAGCIDNRTPGVIVRHNTCIGIGHVVNASGSLTVTNPGTFFPISTTFNTPYPLGRAQITGNSCSFIQVISNQVTASDHFSDMIISDNQISANVGTLLDSWSFTTTGSGLSIGGIQSQGIGVFLGRDDPGSAVISGNSIGAGIHNSVRQPIFNGMNVVASAIISNNKISGFNDAATAGSGIIAFGHTSAVCNYSITGNTIFREADEDITQFIFLELTASRARGVCTDNIFNSPFIDAANTDDETINGTGTGTPASPYDDAWVVERNKNQTDQIMIRGSVPSWTPGTSGEIGQASGNGAIRINNANDTTNAQIAFDTQAAGSISGSWEIGLTGLIPIGTRVVSFALTHSASAVPSVTSTIFFNLFDINGNGEASSAELWTLTPSTILETYSTTFINKPGNSLLLNIFFTGNDGATTRTLSIINPRLTYRW